MLICQQVCTSCGKKETGAAQQLTIDSMHVLGTEALKNQIPIPWKKHRTATARIAKIGQAEKQEKVNKVA